MTKGLDSILDRIWQNPERTVLKERYLALVSELPQPALRAEKILALVAVYAGHDPHAAYQIARLAHAADATNMAAVQSMAAAAEQLGRHDEASALRGAFEAHQERSATKRRAKTVSSAPPRFSLDQSESVVVRPAANPVPAPIPSTSQAAQEPPASLLPRLPVIPEETELSALRPFVDDLPRSDTIIFASNGPQPKTPSPVPPPPASSVSSGATPSPYLAISSGGEEATRVAAHQSAITPAPPEQVTQPTSFDRPSGALPEPPPPRVNPGQAYRPDLDTPKAAATEHPRTPPAAGPPLPTLSATVMRRTLQEEWTQAMSAHAHGSAGQVEQAPAFAKGIAYPEAFKEALEHWYWEGQEELTAGDAPLVWELLQALWALAPHDDCAHFLSRTGLAYYHEGFWGLYLDCLMAAGYDRKALYEVRRQLLHKEELDWALVAWRRLPRICSRLKLQPIKWQAADGAEALRAHLASPLPPTYAGGL